MVRPTRAYDGVRWKSFSFSMITICTFPGCDDSSSVLSSTGRGPYLPKNSVSEEASHRGFLGSWFFVFDDTNEEASPCANGDVATGHADVRASTDGRCR